MSLWVQPEGPLLSMSRDLLLQAWSVYNFVQKVGKGMVQVFPILGTCLEVWDFILLSKLTSTILINGDVINEIHFVSKHDFLCVRVGVFPNFLQPILHIFKTICVCDIVNEDNPRRAFVICVSQRSEFYLACRIPDSHLDLGVSMHDVLLLMVNSCCAN